MVGFPLKAYSEAIWASETGAFAAMVSTADSEEVQGFSSQQDEEVYYAATAKAPNCAGQCQMNATSNTGEPYWLIVNCGGARCSCWGSPDIAWFKDQGFIIHNAQSIGCHY